MVSSYPSVVRLSKVGELNSSLGVSEPRYMLEIKYLMHIGSLGKAIEYLGACVSYQLHRVQTNSLES